MKLLLVLIACAMVGEVNVIGRLTATELILALCAFIALVRGERTSGHVRQFYLFAALWVSGAVVSDLYNGSPFDDIARGWSKIAFFVLNFTALRWLVGTDRGRIVTFVYALMIVGALRLALGIVDENLGRQVLGNGWKFGYGQLFSATSLLASAWFLRSAWSRPLAIAAPLGAAAVALLMNARNLMGLTALAGLAGAFTAGRRRSLSVPHLVALGAAAALAGVLIINVYKYTAREGLLGFEAQDKYLQQTQGNLNLLQAGRGESLASTQAIIDSPIFGHGSWARDITYAMLMMDRLEAAGMDVIRGDQVDDLIPTHSHLLGAWVEHGILGAAFWCWAFWVTVKGVLAAVRCPTPLTGFITFIGFSLLWDILFSPFGLERRVITAAWLYLMILVAEQPAVAVQPAPARPPVRLKSSGVLP